MKVCVQGLWHLGTVTAACLASLGHEVIGLDFDAKTIKNLNKGIPPLFESKLEELIHNGIESNKLKFTTDIKDIENIDLLWIAYDTPVDEDDNANINFVVSEVNKVLPSLNDDTIILFSSQMPVGSIKNLEKIHPNKHFAVSPENLRLGNALNIFLNPDRIVVGVRTEEDKLKIKKLLETITDKIEWMSVESAEMTKHAINSFLATSVVFANEIASLCEVTGADAKEVERGLKSEQRIGPKAYLKAGTSFSGGTLARDVEFLKQVGSQYNLFTLPLLQSIKDSNDEHKKWAIRKVQQLFPNISELKVTIWGITYKAGTDTLRRSLPLQMCYELLELGATVKIYDPIVKDFPDDIKNLVFSNPISSLQKSSVLLIGAEYAEYKDNLKDYNPVETLTIIDPNRYLFSSLNKQNNIRYISVGFSILK